MINELAWDTGHTENFLLDVHPYNNPLNVEITWSRNSVVSSIMSHVAFGLSNIDLYQT